MLPEAMAYYEEAKKEYPTPAKQKHTKHRKKRIP
jgi:hypothetical protein